MNLRTSCMGEAWAYTTKSILPLSSSPFRLFSVHRIKCSCVLLPSPLQPLQPHLDLWSEEQGCPFLSLVWGANMGEVVGQGDDEMASLSYLDSLLPGRVLGRSLPRPVD